MKKPICWVVKEQMLRGVGDSGSAPVDYTPAMNYGDIEFITTHDMPLYGRSSVQEAWTDDVQRFVTLFNPLDDYIITTGQPMAILCVGYALGVVGKKPRFLVWRREENRYRVVHFDADFHAAQPV